MGYAQPGHKGHICQQRSQRANRTEMPRHDTMVPFSDPEEAVTVLTCTTLSNTVVKDNF